MKWLQMKKKLESKVITLQSCSIILFCDQNYNIKIEMEMKKEEDAKKIKLEEENKQLNAEPNVSSTIKVDFFHTVFYQVY